MTKSLNQIVEETLKAGKKEYSQLSKVTLAQRFLLDLDREMSPSMDDKENMLSKATEFIGNYFGAECSIFLTYDEAISDFTSVHQAEKLPSDVEELLGNLRKTSYTSQSLMAGTHGDESGISYFVAPLTAKAKDYKEKYGILQITRKDGKKFDDFESAVLDEVMRIGVSAIQKYFTKVQADTDELTGLATRRVGITNLKREHKRAVRYNQKQGDTYSIIMYDIDKFKKVNDTYGHSQGDEVLKDIAKILKNNFREDVDTIARWGNGEEFLVILPNTEKEGAYNAAERAREAIENHLFTNITAKNDGAPLKITISAGIAWYDSEKIPDIRTIIELADAKLYVAKIDRNKTVC